MLVACLRSLQDGSQSVMRPWFAKPVSRSQATDWCRPWFAKPVMRPMVAKRFVAICVWGHRKQTATTRCEAACPARGSSAMLNTQGTHRNEAARVIQLRYRVHTLDVAIRRYTTCTRAVESTQTDDERATASASTGPPADRRMKRRFVRRHIRPRLVTHADGTQSCEWSTVHAAPSRVAARGLGLFATVPMRAFTRLDYFGVRLPTRDARIRDFGRYCVGLDGDRFCIDAHPKWAAEWRPELAPASLPHGVRQAQLTRLPSNLMLGSFVNEPSPGDESPNVKLFATRDAAYFLATRDISAGEELLTLYGSTYARPYESPNLWLNHEIRRAFWRFREGNFFFYHGSGDASFSPSRIAMRLRRCVRL